MKKFLFVCVAVAASLLFTNTTNAQTQKIGHFDEQLTLSWFPGLVAKLDSAMTSYQNDSLGVEYNYTYSDYQRKDSLYKIDSAKGMPAKAKEIALKEINQLKYKLINWQQIAQQMAENKQEQLLAPFKQRIFNALQEVIKEQKYTYVLNAQALSPYAQPPILDNLSIRVAIKLKLPLPKDYEDAWKAATAPAGAPAGAPKK